MAPGQSSYVELFQSTLPVRGATRDHKPVRPLLVISIHAPREGSDPAVRDERREGRRFQSTLPVRGATISNTLIISSLPNFNPRSP